MPTVFAMGDPISLVHDHPIGNFCVLANDTNTNEDPLVATLITPPSHAASYSLSSDGILSYVPTSFFVGIDTLTYEASSNGETSQATVTIEFTNQAPSLMGQSLSISHGRVLQNIDLLANAYDADGDWLIVSAITAPPAHGTLAQNPANLLWDLTPDSGWTGSDSFQATVSDGVATSWAATFWIDVVNSAPSSASDSYTISHDLTMDTRWSLR
ncbi:MAG: cadherin-like domain-containing protein, partial [Planctomycetes bacterium]|nr:cadherin-like domain-containing protein [Planctomycetota bacterium]